MTRKKRPTSNNARSVDGFFANTRKNEQKRRSFETRTYRSPPELLLSSNKSWDRALTYLSHQVG